MSQEQYHHSTSLTSLYDTDWLRLVGIPFLGHEDPQ